MENGAWFCDEPVLAVYEGSLRQLGDADAFLDCFHDLAYHAVKGCRLLLETEHHVISLSENGAELLEKAGDVSEHGKEGERLESFIHTIPEMGTALWEDYEATLFKGQRLRKVEESGGTYLLSFDDFLLKLVPHDPEKGDMPSFRRKYYMAYDRVLGCERLLTRRCECGGTGELLLDPDFDYVVRCADCGRATPGALKANVAIGSWNEGAACRRLPDVWIE